MNGRKYYDSALWMLLFPSSYPCIIKQILKKMKVTHSTTIELKQLSWLWCIGIWLLKCTKSQVLGQERCNIITKWFTWSGSDAHLNSLLQRGVVNSEISRGLYFYYKFTSEKLIFICVRVCVCVLKVQFCFKGVMETYLPSIG